MKLYLPFMLLLLASGCIAMQKTATENGFAVKNTALPIGNVKTEVKHPRITLDNGLWKLSLVPDTMGGFDRFYNKKYPRGLFWGISYSKMVTGGLLEKNFTDGHMLIERFWQMQGINDSLQPMKITDSGKNFVELWASPYGVSPISLKRRVTLPFGKNCIEVQGTVTNLHTSNIKLRPWINVLPREGKIVRLIPAKGNVVQTSVGSTSRLAQDGIYSLSKERNVFLAPARNFIAASLYPENCTMAILPGKNDLSRSIFYMYNGPIGFKKGSTIEYILADASLKKGEQYSYSYRIAIFENMPQIRDMAGDIAVDAFVQGQKLTVKLAVYKPEKSQKIQVILSNKNGRSIKLQEKMTDDLIPGKTLNLQFELPEKIDDNWNISGQIGGNKFELLKLFLDHNTDLGENFK